MKSILKNIILIIALSAVIIMIIGINLYDYIPSSTTVAEPNTYQTDEETTKVLAEIADDGSLDTDDEDSSSTKSNIVLKSYSITETDLALYAASNSYDAGKADPFADATTAPDTASSNGQTSSSSSASTSSNTTSNTTSSSSTTTSDGTLFNSTSSK